MDTPALRRAKRTLRDEARAARARHLETTDRAAAAAAALAHLDAAAAIPTGATVSGFWPFVDEFDARPILHACHARGHAVVLPAVVAKATPLVFRAWTPATRLVPGVFATLAPPETAPVRRPDVLLVPLLAVDDAGWRLGYGGGFYDRTLAGLRTDGRPCLAIGIAFAAQQVASVPHGPDDQPLDALVTESGWHRFARP